MNAYTNHLEQRAAYPTYRQSWWVIGWFILASLVAGLPIYAVNLLLGISEAITLTMAALTGNLLLAVVLLYWKRKAEPAFRLSLHPGRPQLYLWLLPLTLALAILAEPLTRLLPVPDFLKDTLDKVLPYPFLSFLLLAVQAPVFEEIVFRGIVLDGLLKNIPVRKAVIQSAVLFALVHFNPAQFIITFSMGLLLGWVYYRTRSLYACIFIHFVNNFTAWLLYQLPATRSADTLADLFPSPWAYAGFLLGVAVVALLCIKALMAHFKQHSPVMMAEHL